MIRKLNISGKLTIGFGILVGLVLVVVALSYLASSNATRKIDATDAFRVPTALASARAQANLLRMLGDVRGYLALGDPQFRESYLQAHTAFAANLAELQALSPYFDAENRRRLEELQAAFQEWSELPPQMFDLRDDQLEREPAYKLLAIDGSTLAGGILINIDRLIDVQEQREPSRTNTDLLADMVEFQATFSAMFSALRGYVTTDNRIYKQEYEFNLSANELAWRRLESNRSRLTANQLTTLNTIEAQRTAFLETIPGPIFTILDGDRAREDLYLFSEAGLPLAQTMQELLERMTSDQQKLLQDDLDAGRTALANTNSQNLGTGAAALIIGLLLSLLFARSITRPIRRLTMVAEQIRSGDLTVRASVDSGDEIGTLASTFNGMTGQLSQTLHRVSAEKQRADNLLEVVIPIGVSLSAEKDYNRLLETIVGEAKAFCRATVGSLYLCTQDDHLTRVITFDDTQPTSGGGPLRLEPVPMYDPATGMPNERNVAASAAVSGQAVNLTSKEQAAAFDLAWPAAEGEPAGAPSLLAIPLKNSLRQSVGVLELRGARDQETNAVIPFDENLQQLMESFSSLAGAALEAYIREQSLRQEIRQLRIEIDDAKRQQEVSAIVDSDFFQSLRNKAQAIRSRVTAIGTSLPVSDSAEEPDQKNTISTDQPIKDG